MKCLQKRYRSIRRADDRRDRSRQDHQAAEPVRGFTCSDPERIRRGIADTGLFRNSGYCSVFGRIHKIESREPAHNAQDRQEKQEAENRCNAYSGDSGALN